MSDIFFSGNLTADPELRTTQTGRQVVNFSIASTERKYNKQTQQWEDGDTVFLRCSSWGDLAQHIATSLVKGSRVLAYGKLQQRSYQSQDGSQKTVIELLVNDIGASLKNVTVQISRTQKSNGFTPNNNAGYPGVQTYESTNSNDFGGFSPAGGWN